MNRYITGRKLAAAISIAALSVSCLGLTFSAARKNGQGGDFYQKGDYENALKKYSEAMTEAPEKPQLYFNIGDVLYRQAKFPEAVKLYEKSAAPGDPGLQAKSWYNIGNAKYRSAKKDGDPNALKEAAACYEKSLESDPDDMDAKYNLEFVQRALKQQQQDQQDQKQNQKEQQKEQEKKEQEKKEQEQKDQQKDQQQKEQEKKDQKDQKNKDQEKKDQEKKEQEKKDQEQKEPEQAKQEEKPAGETAQAEKSEQPDKDLSEQQARQLIESLEREERDPTHFMKAEGSPQPTDIDKDW